MGKVFNTIADCKQNRHYMVNLDSRLAQIKEYIDRGEYFTINRARQYGKTTILRALREYLKDPYYVISMEFQMQMSSAKFRSENIFARAFAKAFVHIIQSLLIDAPENMKKAVEMLRTSVQEQGEELELVELFQYLSHICREADKPLVLMIDEADSAVNNQVFLDFLSQLRGYYIHRDESPTFQSVILAGVYDIKNLKRKFRPDEDHKMNSPWNIAVEFKVEMSFSPEEIAGMLKEYENEHATGMNISEIAGLIYDYTSGYPFLVSRFCKLMDEEVAGSENFPEKKSAWTYAGFLAAERILAGEKNTLFESMVNKLYDLPELKEIVYSTLFAGRESSYNALNQAIDMAHMLGFVKNDKGIAVISNRIFEVVFYNFFLSSSESQNTDIYQAAVRDRNQNPERTDVIVDYQGEQMVIE